MTFSSSPPTARAPSAWPSPPPARPWPHAASTCAPASAEPSSQNVTDPRLGTDAARRAASRGARRAGRARRRGRREPCSSSSTASSRVLDLDGERQRRSQRLGSLGVHHDARRAAGRRPPATCSPAPSVIDAVVDGFEAATGELEERLLAALEAGLDAGGEAGPLHSAGLSVVRTCRGAVTDLRVDWSDEPVDDLRELLEVWLPQRDDYVTRGLDPDRPRRPTACPGTSEPMTTRRRRPAADAPSQRRRATDRGCPSSCTRTPRPRWEEHRSARWVAECPRRGRVHRHAGLPRAATPRSSPRYGSGPFRLGAVRRVRRAARPRACLRAQPDRGDLGRRRAGARAARRRPRASRFEVYGTPAEEGGGGKIELLERGAFAGLDLAMMAHPAPVDVAEAEPFAVSHSHVALHGQGRPRGGLPRAGRQRGRRVHDRPGRHRAAAPAAAVRPSACTA